MKEFENFIKNLKYLREKKGISEKELEDALQKIRIEKKIKYKVPNIKLLEQNKSDINMCYYFALADYFDVSYADLIGIDLSQK